METQKNITVVQTAKDTSDRLTFKDSLTFTEDSQGDTLVLAIDSSIKFQEIEGFGGAFTEAGAHTLLKMSPEKRAQIANSYFNPSTGLAYSICRTHINSCDFALGNYSYDDVEGDTELENFSIERDQKSLIPFIKSALETEGADFKLFASPWSPPAWMKTNGEMNHGGSLKKEYWDTWAKFFVKYINAYAKEGINMWGLTVQNEPEAVQTWDSCIYTPEEEGEFVKNHLAPALQANGLSDVKIMIWDHNKDRIYERAEATLSDPEVAKYVWGIAFHWYSGDEFENLTKTHNLFPDKKLLFTEGCQENGVKLGSWAVGERYGHDIIGDLNNWTVGWVDWNMVLDQTGGPNHVGNLCDAPIIANTETDEIHYQNSYYYLGHFSKFVRPGAVRIGLECSSDKLETCAFKNTDGTIAVVVMNRSDEEVEFKLKDGNLSAKATSLPHSMVTYLYK